MSSLQTSRAAVMAAAQTAMLDVLRSRQTASADDIRHRVTIPDGVHPSIIGTAILGLRRAGVIVPVETIPTSRPAGHAHLMRTWRLADPPAGRSDTSLGGEG